ncbi:ABC transporter permease [Paenibacillus sambharensis]|uniref:ABC transporter permease n=1 Tax=Paenibacillus sambharensis TaxID=1803190 RepID=UPI001FE5EAA9|nr:ABC transporter permease [Paenibacillus sambharensis]
MPGWLKFAFGKSVRLAALLAAVSIITFVLISFSPVDPVRAYIGADMMTVGAEQRLDIAVYWGLDQPPLERFLKWVSSMIQGDFGSSMIYREPVAGVIAERFWYSLSLMAAAWLLSGLIGFAAGSAAAMNRGGWLDRVIQWVCYTIASTPSFWIGMLLLMVFAVWLGWLPAGLGVPAGVAAEQVTIADRIRHMVLPAAALSIAGISAVALHTRQKLIDILDSDFVLYARAKGERGWQLYRNHGLRNIALPAMTLQLASFSELFGGAVLAEQVFTYPGLGHATVEAGLRGDVPLLMGLVLFSTLFVFTGNTAADVLYRLVDPRIRGHENDSRNV